MFLCCPKREDKSLSMTIGLLNLTITTPVLEIDSIRATGGIRLLDVIFFTFFFASSSTSQPVHVLATFVDSYNCFISCSTSANAKLVTLSLSGPTVTPFYVVLFSS